MQACDFRVGEIVVFGRVGGECTHGKVSRLNPKRVKIVTLEKRGDGRGSAPGTVWNVSYGLVRRATPENVERFAKLTPPVSTAWPNDTTGPHPIGLRIMDVRPMTSKELEDEGWGGSGLWSGTPMVMVLSDGTLMYASRDPEGNGPGMIFGKHPNRGAFVVG